MKQFVVLDVSSRSKKSELVGQARPAIPAVVLQGLGLNPFVMFESSCLPLLSCFERALSYDASKITSVLGQP